MDDPIFKDKNNKKQRSKQGQRQQQHKRILKKYEKNAEKGNNMKKIFLKRQKCTKN